MTAAPRRDGHGIATRPLVATLASTIAAAGLGNSLITPEDLAWLRSRRRPRLQLSVPAFAAVGIVYYLIMGVVLYRASDRRDSTATRLALVVLVLNEAWNVAFFRGRSTRNGFWGMLLFLVPLVRLQLSVRRDPASAVVLAPYTAWVVCYDLPWTLALWRLDRATGSDPGPTATGLHPRRRPPGRCGA